LVEPYDLGGRKIYHFDLYRLRDAEELELMGIRDYFCDENLCLVEWSERGEPLLPMPDLSLMLTPKNAGRSLQATPHTPRAAAWVVFS
jgi:tRNA threonylcarbamoyladenosine biosynthesis protein TsaE